MRGRTERDPKIMKIYALARRAAVRSIGRTAVVGLALVAMLAPLALLAPVADAQIGGGSDTTGWTTIDLAAELDVPGFDADLGTLVSAELTMTVDIENQVRRVTNNSSANADIFLATQLDLCAHVLTEWAPNAFDACSVAGAHVATSTEISTESFQGVRAGTTASNRTVIELSDAATSAILDPGALVPFVGVESVQLGVSSQQSHLALGGTDVTPELGTLADVTVSVAYTYIALDLEVIDGGYLVTSTGTTTLSNVSVMHDTAGELCSLNLLPPGQTHRCEVPGGVADGSSAIATAKAAINPGVSVTSGVSAGEAASIAIEVATNGADADAETGPKVQAGDLLTWSYVISNTGTDDLVDVAVSDDRTGAICAAASLLAGESFDCTHEGRATSGQNLVTAKATGTTVAGAAVSDTDSTHHIVVNQDGTATAQLATGGGSVTAPLSDAPYAGVEAPRLAFTGAETTVAAVIGASSLLLGMACVGASGRLRRHHEYLDG